MTKSLPAIEKLKEMLSYDPETGELRWAVTPGRRVRKGDVAGVDCGGYRRVRIGGVTVGVHRVVWALSFGSWPVGVIDHINGARGDNRLANLRDVTTQVNNQNIRRPRAGTASGVQGVSWDAERQKWRAIVGVNGKLKRFGRFDTIEEAHSIYLQKKRQLHVGCTI